MRIYEINQNDANQRLDKFIKKVMPTLPDSLMHKGIRTNAVKINSKRCKDCKYILNAGDEVILYFPDEFIRESIEIKKADMPNIVYEDDNIIVANKPKGLPVHSDDKGTEDTLLDRILYYLFEKKEYNPNEENSFRPALCNRLDRNTEGLVIAAKNATALRIINEKIKNREIEKKYLCICDGYLSIKEDILTGYLERDEKKVRIVKGSGKEIKTCYRVLAEKNNKSLLEITLLTGRTHQIRAHLSSIGHPLCGDIKYGGSKNKDGYYLVSYKLLFSFIENAGELQYLNGLEIKLETPERNF